MLFQAWGLLVMILHEGRSSCQLWTQRRDAQTNLLTANSVS